jgi:hypothetical protein
VHNFYLPTKLPSYLLRLEREYASDGNVLHRSIIQNSRSVAIPETAYDNLDGGIHGHDARLYLPLDIHSTIPLRQLNKVAESICGDLNELARQVPDEFFRAVVLDVDDENDPDFQRSIPFSERPLRNPDTLSFWKPGHVRLFVSHRDGHKKGANELAEALEAYGISSFVAHDTIKPLTEWRHEILKGLETMEMMLVYLTDDFEESIWTQQEVGYAIGKGIPVISLKLEKRDPPGFMGNVQAQKGSISDPAASAQAIYKLIAEELGAKERLHDGLVSAFVNSEDFNHARYRFDRMASNIDLLSPAQLESIIKGYRTNPNLYNAFYLDNPAKRLVKYLKRATGNEYRIDGVDIKPIEIDDLDDDIPF